MSLSLRPARRWSAERLDRAPVIEYQGLSTALFFDLSRQSEAAPLLVLASDNNVRSVPPVAIELPNFERGVTASVGGGFPLPHE